MGVAIENESDVLTGTIIGAAIEVHRNLVPLLRFIEIWGQGYLSRSMKFA